MICWGMILRIHLPRGIHEIQSLEISVDFAPLSGTDLHKTVLTPILDQLQRLAVIVDRLALAVAWEGRHMGPLKISVAMQIWSAC